MLKISKNIVVEKLGEDLIILDLISGEYFEANELGSLIINELKKNQDIEQIKKTIMQKFNVKDAVAEDDLMKFINQLDKKGLLEN